MSLTLLKIVGSKKLKPSSPFPSPFPWRPFLLATGYTFFLMIRTFFNPTSYKQTQHLPKYIPSSLSFSELPIIKELASQATYTFFISHSFFNSVTLCPSTLLKLFSLKIPCPHNSGTFLPRLCLTWHRCTCWTLASWSPFPPCLLRQHSSGSSPITNAYFSIPLFVPPHLSFSCQCSTDFHFWVSFLLFCMSVFLSTLIVSTITYVKGFLFLWCT